MERSWSIDMDLASWRILLVLGFVCLPGFLVSCVSDPDADEYQAECMAHRYPDKHIPDPLTPTKRAQRSSAAVVPERIRFTDDGRMVDRCEWTEVLEQLKVKKSQIILIYVHGWKHNADDDDQDRRNFESLLRELAEEEKIRRSDPRQVVGIYIGWNGKAMTLPIIENLSFWSRKHAADQLTQSSVLTKFIGAMTHVRKLQNQQGDLVVYIGHSFGARVLFSATSGLLLYETQMQHSGNIAKAGGPSSYGVIQSPADLIVLLNPAFEALRYTAVDTLRRPAYKENFSAKQQPIMLTIATNNDWATGTAFPIGQWIGREWEALQRTTLGNYTKFSSHEISLSSEARPPSDEFWYDNFCNKDDKGSICLRRKEADKESPYPSLGNPFLVATTNESVLSGHNGIWNPSFVKWLKAFIKELDGHKNGVQPER